MVVGTILFQLLLVFVGFLISLFLSPLFSGRVTQLYTRLGVYDPPPVNVRCRYKETGYDVGTVVDEYGGIEWKESYGVYVLTIQNQGNQRVNTVRTELFFPGIVRTVRKPEVGEAEFQVLDRRLADATVDGQPHEVVQCSKKISAESLYPDEGLVVEFVVDHDLSDDPFKHDLNPRQQFEVEYRWKAQGYPFTETIDEQVEDAEAQYATALVNRGIWLRERRADPPGATADFDHALDIYPDFPPALFQKGLTHLKAADATVDRDHLEKAISLFEDVTDVAPRYAQAWKHLGECYLWLLSTQFLDETETEDYRQRGIECASTAVEIDPEYTEARTLLENLEGFEHGQDQLPPDQGEVKLPYHPSSAAHRNGTTLLEVEDEETGVELCIAWTDENRVRFEFTAPDRSGACSLPMDDFDGFDEFLITGTWEPERLILDVLPEGENVPPQQSVTQF